MNYLKLTKNLFGSQTFSRNELNLFATDLISRLTTMQNSVLPTADKTLLVTLHQDFVNTYGTLAMSSAVQKGGTISRQDAYDAILEFIGREEGAIKAKFGKNTPIYTEFYPQGLREYYGATVEGIKVLLYRYSATAAKYTAQLSADFVRNLTTLQTAYVDARETQVSSKSSKKSSQTEMQKNRKALTEHLTTCVLLIAARTIGNEAAFNSYFNFGLLLVDNDNPTPPDEPTAPIV
ncbi:MAG: hypothetical protein V4538_14115 [Bacteroidota bacterium]